MIDRLTIDDNWKLSTPICLIIFKRPEVTRKVLNVIRQVRPPRLFVAADGPRVNIPEEAEQCLAARAVLEEIDWECQVYKNYSDVNMGCRNRVSTGITWALSHEESIIVLEDDCLPTYGFFYFCDKLLEKYKNDERIMVISGNNFQDGISRSEYSYYFSKYPHCWGWATWRRAWKYWEFNYHKWQKCKQSGLLESVHKDPDEFHYWTTLLEQMFTTGKPDSWVYPWGLACWLQNGLTILPNYNLVSNIGFNIDSTHTKDKNSQLANLLTYEISEISHPEFIQIDYRADRYTYEKIFKPKSKRFIILRFFNIIKKLFRSNYA